MNQINNLVNEKSPYLLQHAYNPINWYTWSSEAFEKAKKENKPIFVSIGYSTCHWCHVMAKESFEDLEVSEYLNENYICIKVDREERPDIDEIYMDACVKLTGHGGWPLSVFINSDKRPFYAGTYFPKNYFLNLIKRLKDIWDKEQNIIESNARIISESIKEENVSPSAVDPTLIHNTFKRYLNNYDSGFGGLNEAPKFPLANNLLFLLTYGKCFNNLEAKGMCFNTLDNMRKGGIYDHLGFGFSRYSTDEKWLVPHFEKMLYDNAQLMDIYAKAYKESNKEIYKRTAIEISEYLRRKMQDPLGGFYTAEDADSEGSEGTFYIFLKEEVENLLDDKIKEFCEYYNITEEGNFEGENILNLLGKNFDLIDEFEEQRNILFNYQKDRDNPFIDKKILLSDNALTIIGFCSLYEITKDEEDLKTAIKIYDFIYKYLYKDNKLYSSYIDGEVKYIAYAKDYAYFINALIDLHQVTLDEKYISKALDLCNLMLCNFYDHEYGGFFQTDKDAEIIIHRKKESHDGAIPSSNSVMIYNLIRLFEINSKIEYLEAAKRTIKYLYNYASKYPLAYMYYSYALMAYVKGFTSIKLIANSIADISDYLKVIQENDLSYKIITFEKPNEDYKLLDNLPTAYVCFRKECLPPINSLDNFKKVLLEG